MNFDSSDTVNEERNKSKILSTSSSSSSSSSSSLLSDNKNLKGVKVTKKENSNAKNRWRLLARAILSNNKFNVEINRRESPISDVSQIFTGFDLVQVDKLHLDDDESSTEKDENVTIKIDIDECNSCFECNVHIEKLWTLKDLIGFNNTGNITFWTSEAALTYYVLENLQIFNDSWILELGGGMFCLSGLMLAKYSNAFAVHLTDGNHRSLSNVRKSIRLNDLKTFVKSSGWFPFELLKNSFHFHHNKKLQFIQF